MSSTGKKSAGAIVSNMDVRSDRRDAPPSPIFWYSLPRMIQIMILDFVLSDAAYNETAPDRTLRASALSTVCRDWQPWIERHTFHSLMLKDLDLRKFGKLVRGGNANRLGYIGHLYLRIDLARYTWRSCKQPENVTTIDRNNRIFTSAVRQLLTVLSSWDRKRGGLELEISAQSPSDFGHHCYEFELADDYPFRLERDLGQTLSLLEYHTRKRVELRSVRRDQSMLGSKERLHGTPLQMTPLFARHIRPPYQGKPMPTLPEAPIVKGFLIRPLFFRGVELSTLAKILRESFVALEWFRFERWTSLTADSEVTFYTDLQTLLIPALPRTVKKLSFNQWRRSWAIPEFIMDHYDVRKSLSQSLVPLAFQLTEFCPPQYLNVPEFLHQLSRNANGRRSEAKLELLTLRICKVGQHAMDRVLTLAAKAARELPRLRILEIWNNCRGHENVFRYAWSNYQATITWTSAGEELPFLPAALGAWKAVASERSTLPLVVERRRFPEDEGIGLGLNGKPIYRHLALRRLVVHPITQERMEAERYMDRHKIPG